MDALFSNNGYWIRCFVCLAALLAGFIYADVGGEEVNPNFWACLLQHDRFDGKHIWVPGAEIAEIEPYGFTIVSQGRSIFVKGDPRDFREHIEVSLTGTFRWDMSNGRGYIELEKIEAVLFPILLRRIVEFVSVAVLVMVLWLFLKRFRLDISGGIIRRRNLG